MMKTSWKSVWRSCMMNKDVAISVVCLFALVLALVLVVVIPLRTNHLRWSQEKIRNYVLELTPLGTSMEDVITVIEGNKKWKEHRIIHEWENVSISSPIIGEKAIFVNAGTYRSFYLYLFLVNTSVGISW